MATSNSSSVLRGVVAYVDVWSAEKTANYSEIFIQQLEEMGAQVTKRFNKQVTHVVFHNGHPATWTKAKNSDVKLVSVLWVAGCYDHCKHADEELYPAQKETNPEFKNKKHRCMQGKDSPGRTPDNDRRIRKKLELMMKDRLPKQPLVSDVSPIIIDEDNGIVYSPGLKRSDYMAARLRDMKENRENLPSTASQIFESCSPTGSKPSLGSTPTVLKLTFDQSDDDSRAAEPVAAEPAAGHPAAAAAAEPAHSAAGDDDVFEDFFSPVHRRQKPNRASLPSLPMDTNIEIPFELASVGKKRKTRRSLLETSSKKKKVDERDGGRERSNAPQQEDKRTLECLRANVTPVARRMRQSTLAFPNTTSTAKTAKRRASTSSLSVKLNETGSTAELQTHLAHSVHSQNLQSTGSTCSVAAGFKECEDNGSLTLCIQNMGKESKVLRTLVMTSMPTEKQHIVSQVVKTLGGFSIVDQVCESTTHVVTGGHRRTLNILLGIARGCWILSFEWILWCLEQRQWIPEEPYELSDQFPAAQISRLQRHLSAGEHQQDLFQSQPPIFISQHSQPPTQSLVELIQLCGGTVSRTVRQAGICIGRYSGRRPEGSRILSEQWVLDSITHLKQMSYEDYDLE